MLKYWKDIVGTVAGTVLTVSMIWIGTNVVWASDLERVEKLMLIDQRRDISRDLRSLGKDDLTESEKTWKALLEDDLDLVQAEIEKLDGDD